jgi:hypothetical protein
MVAIRINIGEVRMAAAITDCAIAAPLPHLMHNAAVSCMIYSKSGDDRHRRKEMEPGGKPRGAELVKSAQLKSANRTNYAALPLAA